MAMAMAMVMIGGMVLLWVWLVKWNELKYRRKGLPPGTLGWPVFGETIKFLKQGSDFMKEHTSRYGSFFMSHILGSPTIISMDPEVNRYILLNEGKGLIPGYPKSMLDILGKHNIAAVHGSTHRYIRGALLSLVSPSMIKDHLLSKIDQFMRSHITTHWGNSTNQFVFIDIQQKTKEMALLSALNQIVGTQSNSIQSEFAPEFFKLVSGTISLPINLPGTSYRRAFQARENIVRILERLMKQRRQSEESHCDMLHMMMNGGGGGGGEDKHYELSDEEIIDQMLTIVYSGYETISTTTMMCVKFLHDHPRVLEELRKEHNEIRVKKKPEDPITWEDYKQMHFTRAVILETSRLATVVNGFLRKPTKDIELNGYLIPKGWRIYVYIREINYDTSMYPDPLTYNPWRWMQQQQQNKSLEYQNNFLLFGGGTRLCPGKELGITEISTFLHYFVTQYRWEEVGGYKLVKFPRVHAPNGLHMRVSSYSNS